MEVTGIEITSVAGIQDIEIHPGRITVIEGRNGSGKTSIIEAIKGALGGGHDATLLRKGARSGQVVIALSDGTAITKRIGAEKSDVRFEHPEFGRLAKPQAAIERIADMQSVNPVAFLLLPAKKRLEYLLEICPIEIASEEIAEALGPITPPPLARLSGLDLLDAVRRHVYDTRTSTNGAAREKRGAIEQLGASLPDGNELARDHTAELKALDERIHQLDQDLASEIEVSGAEAQSQIDAAREQIHKDQDTAAGILRAKIEELDIQIQQLQDDRRDLVHQMSEVDLTATARLNEIAAGVREQHGEQRREIESRYAAERTELREQYTQLAERAREMERHQNTAKILEGMRREAEGLEQRSIELTEAIRALDALKVTKMAALPVPGVEIADGELLVDGVPFDRVNRARQVEVAIELAKLRAGELRLICVDNLECLDSETFAAFCERAKADNLQLIVTRVTDSDLTVTTLDAEEVA